MKKEQRDKNLTQAIEELETLCDKLFIPQSIKEKAITIYSTALDRNLIQGRSVSGMSSAALYSACRATGFPRSFKEIVEATSSSRWTKKEIAKNYHLLIREGIIDVAPPDPLLYISKIAERLGISMKSQELAVKYLSEAKQKLLTVGRNPMGIAAAALYMACAENNEKITQRDLAEAAGVAEVTIRKRYLSLKEGLRLPYE